MTTKNSKNRRHSWLQYACLHGQGCKESKIPKMKLQSPRCKFPSKSNTRTFQIVWTPCTSCWLNNGVFWYFPVTVTRRLSMCAYWILWFHCVLWATFQHQFFWGLFPNAEWNTLSRALWIFVWNVLKHNIVEFRGLWGSICSNHCVLRTTSQNQNFFGLFRNAEWNALSTALWIFVCIILKHDIVEFHANGQVIIAQITDCNDCFTAFQVTIFLNFHDRNRTFEKLRRLNTLTSGCCPRMETNFVFDPPFCHVCYAPRTLQTRVMKKK